MSFVDGRHQLALNAIGTLCEDRVRDGPASGEKGSKGEFYIGENLSK